MPTTPSRPEGSPAGTSPELSRRRLLQLSTLGGTAVLGAGALVGGAGGIAGLLADAAPADAATKITPPPTPQLSVPAPGPTADPSKGVVYFSNANMQFNVLFGFGATAYGVGEFGELTATVNQIKAAGESYQSYYDNFVYMGNQISSLADAELKAGHRASARSAYLRATQYFNQALFFVLGTSAPSAEPTVYAAMQRQWNLAAQLMDPPFERVAIPYGRTTLPGYFLRPSTKNVRRPTVIINNGSDAQNLDTYTWGGAAALERGWNALLFEGPGQGSMLFERQIPFRPDWENVITPIVDWLRKRPDVDTKRIGLTGWSMGGELVARAAAYETRLAAVVSDPGLVDVWPSWPQDFQSLFAAGATKEDVNGTWTEYFVPAIEASPDHKFDVAKRSEIFGQAYLNAARDGKVFTDMWSFGHTLMQFDATSVLSRITMPYLVNQYELDVLVPAADPKRLYNGLDSKSKKLFTFTAAEGAEYHCAPMAPQRRNQVVYDWMGTAMGAS